MRRRNFLALGSAGLAMAGTRSAPAWRLSSCGCSFLGAQAAARAV